MNKPLFPALFLVLLLCPTQDLPGLPRGFGPFAEFSAGPLVGIDMPLKGCAGTCLLGLAAPPFEAGIRSGAAFDTSLGSGSLRFDFELALGSGLRAIVGGLFPLGALSLPEPSGTGARVAVKVANWPNRFGLASTLFVLPWRILSAQALLDAELVYTDYRLQGGPAGSAATSLSGAAAFAAGVEAGLAMRLRWSP